MREHFSSSIPRRSGSAIHLAPILAAALLACGPGPDTTPPNDNGGGGGGPTTFNFPGSDAGSATPDAGPTSGGSCQNPGAGTCAKATDLFCGSGCCAPGYPYACASTGYCYATAAEAEAACGMSCVACAAPSTCTPSCAAKTCGSPDGCGGTCAPGSGCTTPAGSCQSPGGGTCSSASDLFCGSGCCAPGYPYACASTGYCYATTAQAAAACGTSCTACVAQGSSGGGTCNGCVDSTGTCQPGTSPDACGTGGAACNACLPGLRCNAGACGHAGWPTVPDNGGPVMQSLKLVTIAAANDEYATDEYAFGDSLAASSWWITVARDYGLGTPVQPVQVTGPAIVANVDVPTIVSYIQQAIASGAAPAPNGSTLYLLYLPDNVQVVDEPGACGAHDGYPSRSTSSGDGFAWIGRAQGSGCFGNTLESVVQMITRTASHEILEAASDPTIQAYHLPFQPTPPWNSTVWAQRPGEIGDLCFRTRIVEADGYEYQRIWSTSAAAAGGDPCAPAVSTPYFNVSASYDWYALPAGTSGAIPIVGWSTGSRGTWLVAAAQESMGSGGFTGSWYSLQTSLGPTQMGPSCAAYDGMNNGVTGEVQITAPPGVQSGDWAIIDIVSWDEDPTTCEAPSGADFFHEWLVGVYVP